MPERHLQAVPDGSVPRAAFWPILKRWADSYEYGNLDDCGGTSPWLYLSEKTGRSDDFFRTLGRGGPDLTFAQADVLLCLIGRTCAWFAELADFYPEGVST